MIAMDLKTLCASALRMIAALLCFLSGSTHAQLCDDTGASLRLLTYNVAMVAAPESNEAKYGMQDAERAKRISQRILSNDHDIIVLNEVFDDTARWSFYESLSEQYPHVVYEVEDYGLYQDSGLMVFSQHPFEPLSSTTEMNGNIRAVSNGRLSKSSPVSLAGSRSGTTGGSFAGVVTGFNWEDVAFISYDGAACTYPDCWADKGVALVRVRNSCTNQVENIVFTHMQANYYGDDDADARAERRLNRELQMKSTRRIITETLTEDEMRSESVYLLGDLNVSGDPEHIEKYENLYSQNEWKKFFHPDGFHDPSKIKQDPPAFTACGDGPCTWDPMLGTGTYLTDTWGFETSKTDPGITNGGEGRLDYILRNRVELPGFNDYEPGFICAQHLRVAWELGEDGGLTQLSDHMGVGGDFNRWATLCNPNDALLLSPEIGDTKMQSGTITYPGSMQWYRIEKPGTYSLQTGSLVDFLVYEHSDLSNPISFKDEHNESGKRFVVGKKPVLIRVFGSTEGKPDRSVTGNYELRLNNHDCMSKQFACELTPAKSLTIQWPAAALSPAKTMWLRFQTAVADDGTQPDLEFLFQRSTDLDFNVDILEEDNISASHRYSYAHGWQLSPRWTGVEDMKITSSMLPGDGNEEKHYYLKLSRVSADDVNSFVGIEYTTNLTYLYPKTLYCELEDDWIGDDEIFMFLDADATTPVQTRFRNASYTDLGDYATGSRHGIDRLGPIKFINHVVPNLIEDDDITTGNDDYLKRMIQHEEANAITQSHIIALSPFVTEQGGTFRWSNYLTFAQMRADDTDLTYSYIMEYDLSHEAK